MRIKVKDKGIACGKDVTEKLQKLLQEFKDVKEEKILEFEKGEYFISSDNAVKKKLYITNTIGDNEWEKNEEPHLNTVAVLIENVNDLIFEGNGCTFVLDGQMTNVSVIGCKNVVLKDFAIRTVNPDMHEFKVVDKKINYIDFEIDAESRYACIDGKYYFTGKDYCVPFNNKSTSAFWIGRIREDNPNNICRVSHPLLGSYKIKELSSNLFRAYYLFPKNYKKGDKFYCFDVRRKYAGIFVDNCENITLEGISQYFNYSLAVVCQNSKDITIDKCRFAPEKNSSKLMASVADFIQICMCRGVVNIKDNYFEGSGDDCLNVHGIHFPIVSHEGRNMTVKFAHLQSHGFNPLREGDTVKMVDPKTLLGGDTAKIISSESVGEKVIKLVLDHEISAPLGYVIEDIDACPDLNFENNTMSRIITRGVLVTTSGKVRISNNKFINTSMHSILISDDAKSWYESGNVQDVVIENNYFGECPMYNVFVKPENAFHRGYVHKNITIKNNTFDSGEKGGLYFKSTDNIVISDNVFKGAKRIKSKNSDIVKLQ